MKGLYKTILSLLVVLLITHPALKAQDVMVNDTVNKDVLYKKFRNYGIMAGNRGYGINFSYGKNKTAFRSVSWDWSLQTIKHPKEVESISNYDMSRPFRFGKINSVVQLGLNRTVHRQISDKPYWGGVEIRMFYSGGLSVALAKPIHYYIATEIDAVSLTYKYDVMELDETIDIENIIAPASYFTGINGIIPYPSINLGAGFSFDHASEQHSIRKLSIGATLDIFPIPLEILHKELTLQNPEYFLARFFISYQLGSNFN
jgi:hypothetical protein